MKNLKKNQKKNRICNFGNEKVLLIQGKTLSNGTVTEMTVKPGVNHVDTTCNSSQPLISLNKTYFVNDTVLGTFNKVTYQ